MSLENQRTAARRLNDRLSALHESWGSGELFDAHPQLLGQLVSRIALAENGRDAQYIGTELSEQSLRVTLFLERTVVDASFKEGALVVDVLPLDIASMRVTSTQDAYDDERVDPEKPLAVNVTLVEGRTLTLRGTGADDDDLTKYLPQLFARLGGE